MALRAAGRLLLSIPNVAYWHVRWNLLRGRFDYENAGILDRSHLRFYTFRTARTLIEKEGFRVVEQDFTYSLPWVPIGGRIILKIVRSWPNFFAYQSLFAAEPIVPVDPQPGLGGANEAGQRGEPETDYR